MIGLAGIAAHRIVADPAALDRATWPEDALRLAPDEVLLMNRAGGLTLTDANAIVEKEAGFSGATLSDAAFEQLVRPHIDWAIPLARPALSQGLVAGVPCKLWFANDEVLVLCLTAHVHELETRL